MTIVSWEERHRARRRKELRARIVRWMSWAMLLAGASYGLVHIVHG